ncbi:PQQ-dependent sugar dehydrogenase [Candidatus Venteria ishoeyi]|uniref:Soluble aldose sugar dehydrogenase YliI n=3 Tax=Candidatus Venteria ishoeyi TaxID=1899563 RepID=A0A1H6F8C3_9GAMM|nr:PQQ-dependent sugar dehydrogenase [Candidatus Venteria ishoeyi]SEH06377.1 Soluble aldose sugar dehydrogenase YliI precursor [Candidatus Venteria ishoeyi]
MKLSGSLYHHSLRFKMWLSLLTLCCAIPLVAAQPLLQGHSAGMVFQVEVVAQGLGVPWGMAFVNAKEILITQRNGKLQILNPQTGALKPVTGGPKVLHAGQGGLLDVAVAPDYKPGGWIYFTYSKPQKGGGATTLARARHTGQQLLDWQDLLITRSVTDTGQHFGSRIAFDSAGHVFFSVGDRGVRPNGQDLSTHAGSILRLLLDGSVPADNPFVKQDHALPEIWSYGHRNPQGLVFDKNKQRLWAIEHGPRGGDEINLIRPGRNYGWAVISHGKEYWGPFQVGEGTHKKGMEQAVKVYIPSIAPGSLMLYSGKAFPAWQGNLFAGALSLRHLNRITLDETGKAVAEERLLESLKKRIRAVIESPEGWLYLSTDNGSILRLKPKAH